MTQQLDSFHTFLPLEVKQDKVQMHLFLLSQIIEEKTTNFDFLVLLQKTHDPSLVRLNNSLVVIMGLNRIYLQEYVH